jgi:hypothetical protein
MILKIKALIYRYTGIYLAYREELEYLTSYEFWTKFKKMSTRKANDLSLVDIQSIILGMWQADHGFYTVFVFHRNCVVRAILRPLKQLKYDLGSLFRK